MKSWVRVVQPPRVRVEIGVTPWSDSFNFREHHWSPRDPIGTAIGGAPAWNTTLLAQGGVKGRAPIYHGVQKLHTFWPIRKERRRPKGGEAPGDPLL